MRNYRLWIYSFVAIVMIVPIPAHATSAINTIQTQVDKALDLLRNPTEKKEEKEKKILALADEIFNYTELSRLSLANYWKAFTPEQQKEFIRLFGKLLTLADQLIFHLPSVSRKPIVQHYRE